MVDNGGDCDILAAEIEHFVFKQFDNTEMKYKNRIRSRIANLKVCCASSSQTFALACSGSARVVIGPA